MSTPGMIRPKRSIAKFIATAFREAPIRKLIPPHTILNPRPIFSGDRGGHNGCNQTPGRGKR